MGNLREALANVVRSSSKGRAMCEAQIEARHRALPALEQGQRFTLHRDCCESQADLERVFEVVRVTAGSAVVRVVGARHVEIKGADGEVKAAWDAPGRTLTMSVEASVVLVGQLQVTR